jgi:hypothetical protein
VIETVVLIPIKDNQGRPFGRSAWEELEARLLQFGGFTGPTEVEGVWRSGERTFRDTNAQYIVSLTSWTQLPDWLGIVHWARERFRQEAIYVKVAGIPEIIAGG